MTITECPFKQGREKAVDFLKEEIEDIDGDDHRHNDQCTAGEMAADRVPDTTPELYILIVLHALPAQFACTILFGQAAGKYTLLARVNAGRVVDCYSNCGDPDGPRSSGSDFIG